MLKPKTQILLSAIGHAELHELVTGFAGLMGGWARHWLAMPQTIIDAGFKSTITLESCNSDKDKGDACASDFCYSGE